MVVKADKKPRVLSPIPLEVLQVIGSHLDRHTACQLALTCKGLRDAGESRIWRCIEYEHGPFQGENHLNSL